MKTKTNTKTRGRGRPVEYKWGKLSNYWRGSSNNEIAEAIGCTPARVCQMRSKIIAAAKANGKDVARFQSKVRYGRNRPEQVAKIRKYVLG